MQDRKEAFLSQRGLAGIRDGVKQYLDDEFEKISRTMQRSIIGKVIPSVVIKSDHQVEIQIATPFRELVTNEDKSLDREWRDLRSHHSLL